VIKPNNSSASWGVRDAGDLEGVAVAVRAIHDEGHDAIVEPFLNGSDVEVPVITKDGGPLIMPMMLFQQADPTHLRTHEEKRGQANMTCTISPILRSPAGSRQ
jgi:D-alanine-D-alanine ligase